MRVHRGSHQPTARAAAAPRARAYALFGCCNAAGSAADTKRISVEPTVHWSTPRHDPSLMCLLKASPPSYLLRQHSCSYFVPRRARAPAVCMAKPCDRFWNGTHELCGPALLVPGLGKCGTNALTKYLELHPRVRNTNDSEAMFDPRDVSPTAFVQKHNPGVLPGDPLVWIAKHPGLENRHADVLARRLRRHFPSSSVALSLCNPMQRAFRFFIYFMEYELKQNGKRVNLAKFAHSVLKRRFNTTVTELFSSIVSVRTDCVRPHVEEGTGRLRRVYFGWRPRAGMFTPGPLRAGH